MENRMSSDPSSKYHWTLHMEHGTDIGLHMQNVRYVSKFIRAEHTLGDMLGTPKISGTYA